MKRTVKEIRAMLETLPDELPVEFMPISMAWLGTMHPMRFDDLNFYSQAGDLALPTDPGAHLQIHLVEDRPQ